MDNPTLDISLSAAEYISGELIQGKLSLTLPPTVLPEAALTVSLTFAGLETVSHVNNPKDDLENVFINDTFSIMVTTKPATFSYTQFFTITVPNILPCTVKYSDSNLSCSIQYSVTGTVSFEKFGIVTIKKPVRILTYLLPIWYDRHHFSDTEEVGCTCCLLCCHCCCHKDLTKLEVIMAREIHIGDCKIPLVLNIDNSICRKPVASIQLRLVRSLAVRDAKGVHKKSKILVESKETIAVKPKEQRTNFITSVPLIDKEPLLEIPTVYSKNIICEYQLTAELKYGSGCCLCAHSGPKLKVSMPVVEPKKALEESDVIEEGGVKVRINVANVVDPHYLMKLRLNL